MKRQIYWLRLILGALGVEVAAVLLLVILVAAFGPNNAEAARAFADRLGAWVGPVAGSLFTFIGACAIARRLSRDRFLHGVLFGVSVALLDVAILVATRAPFAWVFVFSNLLKLLAGYLGGVCAARSAAAPDRGQDQ